MEVEEAGPIAPDKNLRARNTRLKGLGNEEGKTRLLERMHEATVVGLKRSGSHRCILETGRKGKRGREEAGRGALYLHSLRLDWIRRRNAEQMPLLCPAGVPVLKKIWETAVGARKSC